MRLRVCVPVYLPACVRVRAHVCFLFSSNDHLCDVELYGGKNNKADAVAFSSDQERAPQGLASAHMKGMARGVGVLVGRAGGSFEEEERGGPLGNSR